MGTTVTWGELITVGMYLLGTGVLFYMVLAAANLVRILRNINKMLEETKPHITKTVEKLPEITENAAKISGLLGDNMESITKVMGNVGKISESARNTVETLQKDILTKVAGILGISAGVRKFFVKKNKTEKTAAKPGSTVYRYTYKKEQQDPSEVFVEKTEHLSEDETIAPKGKSYEKADLKNPLGNVND
jgi:hypothetical protein